MTLIECCLCPWSRKTGIEKAFMFEHMQIDE